MFQLTFDMLLSFDASALLRCLCTYFRFVDDVITNALTGDGVAAALLQSRLANAPASWYWLRPVPDDGAAPRLDESFVQAV